MARRGNPKGRRRSPEAIRVLRNAENIEEWRILNSLSVKKRKKEFESQRLTENTGLSKQVYL